MKNFILIAIAILVSEVFTYKFVKYIDKKERKKLYEWELKYIQELEALKKAKKKEVKKNDCDIINSNSDNSNSIPLETSGKDNLQATK